MFGGEWAENEQISFGACEVQLPFDRKIGATPRPSVFKLQFREDPDKHIIIKSCEDLDPTQFYREVSERGPSVLFFVHGYCVTFAEAVYKTAQIVDDIDFGGAPICYSWPSNGHFWAYTTDEDRVQWTRHHLLTVLRETIKLTGVTTINIIAHSMGNRAVVECLDTIAQEFSGGKVHQINQVVFAAPDVNAGVFRQFLDKIKGAAKRFTLYASSNDKPLKWSQWFRGLDRAGQGGAKLVLHPNLDSIDASSVSCGVLDHSYYGATFTVLSDIHELFSYNSPPPRFAIRGPRNDGKGDYWEIKT
jgi:esterase/lipase superfamily enzyme